MFQTNDAPPQPPTVSNNKKAAGIFRNGDDEDEDGQVWRSKDNGEAAENEDEYDDEGNPKPGVIPIIPYNMDRENEEGSFDANGHYIEKKDEQAFHDSWMQGITKKDMRKAKLMQDRREARQRLFADVEKRHSSGSSTLKGKRLEYSYWCGILSLIRPGESTLGVKKIGDTEWREWLWVH